MTPGELRGSTATETGDDGRLVLLFPPVLFSFSCFIGAMQLPPLVPEPVTFEEAAAILDEAATLTRGGPPYVIGAAGWHLAAALDAAGFRVVRAPAPGSQLTL